MSRRYNGLDFNRKPQTKISGEHIRELISWLFWIVISAVIAFVLMYVYGFRTNVIGNSMEPGLYSGQQILIDRLSYNVSMPKRGDVVAFVPNGNEDTHISVTRIIGLPGEKVMIKDGYVYIDGVLLDEAGAYDKIADPGILEQEIELGDDQFIVLGDNRNFSEDSRSGNIGVIESGYMVGRVWFKLSGNLEQLGIVR